MARSIIARTHVGRAGEHGAEVSTAASGGHSQAGQPHGQSDEPHGQSDQPHGQSGLPHGQCTIYRTASQLYRTVSQVYRTASPTSPTASRTNRTATRVTRIRLSEGTQMNDKNVRPRGIIALVLGIVLSVGFVSTNAIAKSSPVTKITFKLDDHHVPPGAAVTSDILVRTRSNHEWVPFASASLSVQVDGTQVLTVVTGVDGHATVSYVAPEGGHVMRVVFLGDTRTSALADRKGSR